MTEIPEHLLKRAQAARDKAAEEAAPAAAAPSAEAPASDPRIPAHLLERSRSAKSKTDSDSAGGGVAVLDKVAAGVTIGRRSAALGERQASVGRCVAVETSPWRARRMMALRSWRWLCSDWSSCVLSVSRPR